MSRLAYAVLRRPGGPRAAVDDGARDAAIGIRGTTGATTTVIPYRFSILPSTAWLHPSRKASGCGVLTAVVAARGSAPRLRSVLGAAMSLSRFDAIGISPASPVCIGPHAYKYAEPDEWLVVSRRRSAVKGREQHAYCSSAARHFSRARQRLRWLPHKLEPLDVSRDGANARSGSREKRTLDDTRLQQTLRARTLCMPPGEDVWDEPAFDHDDAYISHEAQR